MKELLLTLLLLSFFTKDYAQTPAHEMATRLGTGYNFGNVMSANNEGDWAAPIEEFMMDDVAEAGFDHIRLPVRWGSHTSENAPYTVDPAWLERVEEVVDWALERNLIVVLNAHGEHWFIEEVTKDVDVYPHPEKWDRMLEIWRQISTHFKGKSHDIVFELINEPYFNMNKKLVDQLNVELLEIVRKDHPDRIVMLTGGGDNAIYAPQQMDPAIFENDDKLIPWFHFYWPNTFTKYPEIEGSKPTWGSKEEYESLRSDFENVKSWADQLNVPLYLGEFGSNNVCDPVSRAKYHSAIVELSQELDFPRAIWCAGPKANKMIYKRVEGEWDKGQLAPLFPKENKKNVVLIMIDDLNTDLFAFGNEEVITPNIDALSEQGIQYTNTQCSYPVCGPSRASLLTGTYPERNGVTNLTLQLNETAPELTTLPELLSQNGYKTAAVGKIFDPRNVDNGHHEQAWTSDYTDPSHYTYPDEYGDFVSGNKYRVEDGMSYEIGPENVGDDGYQDGQFTEHALELLDEFSASSQPFFLAVGYKKPHLPFVAPKKYFDLYEGKDISLAPYQKMPEGADEISYKEPTELTGYKDIPEVWEDTYLEFENVLNPDKQKELVLAYYACASYIDAQIGQIVNRLEQLGEKDNTLLIITSDHGFNLGDHNMWGKHNLLRNSAQVPMIIIDPSELLPTTTTDRATQLIDLYPTVCDFTYTPKPSFLQGSSLFLGNEVTTQYPLDLSVTYYKKNSKNGYTFKRGNYKYTLWTSDKGMTPMLVPYQNVTAYHEEFYVYNGIQDLERENQINNSAYASEIAAIKDDVAKWWSVYFSHVNAESSSNIIRINNDFEQGVETGWTATFKKDFGIDFSLVAEEHPVNKTTAATFHITQNGGNFSNLALRSEEYSIGYTTEEEKTVKVTFDVYSTTDTEIRYQLQCNESTVKLNSENITVAKNQPVAVESEIVIGEGISTMQIAIQIGKVTGTFYIDNVVLKIDGDEDKSQKLKEAVDAVEVTYQGGDSKNAVTNNLILSESSLHSSTVTWKSSNSDVIKINNEEGVVTRQDTDQTVVLDAEVAYENLVETKTFVVKVLAKPTDKLQEALDEINITYQGEDNESAVTQDITLVNSSNDEAKVTWTSSNKNVIEILENQGVVTRDEEDQEVKILAKVELNGESGHKEFTLHVVGTKEEAEPPTPPTSLDPELSQIKVYPNPAHQVVHIITDQQAGEELRLYNIRGALILNQKHQSKTQLDISGLPKGVYILKIGYHINKLIVE
ncbi:sulfatase-like hydrolase/transferase [Flammeovirga agarivorans]|uniref:Sulfatase-like hydrolase/transferase n=1 Tax=Flammeovirga agarivorans TaxID=2726742 RepID=A0A7X8SJ01_9BACT|nr:sulfatase-like hydrolase/transferase [Flammeovirga agarivorans]NLR91123.1 sulfatase-like hydrolase/transferase [Flammeovirga agarivorans]